MLSKMLVLCGLISLGVVVYLSAPSSIAKNDGRTVTDISWPNCATRSNLGSSSGIIGVNGGRSFSSNNCMYSESKLFDNYSLYLNTGLPGLSHREKFALLPRSCGFTDGLCLAYNYGFNAAHFAVSYANLQSVHATMWWLDVETSNTWSDDVLQNRASLKGMIDALNRYTFLPTVGFYSTPAQWTIITGDWKNNFPVWVATGSDRYDDAVSFCKNENFTGGTTWLAQYTTQLDHSYICNTMYLTHLKVSI